MSKENNFIFLSVDHRIASATEGATWADPDVAQRTSWEESLVDKLYDDNTGSAQETEHKPNAFETNLPPVLKNRRYIVNDIPKSDYSFINTNYGKSQSTFYKSRNENHSDKIKAFSLTRRSRSAKKIVHAKHKTALLYTKLKKSLLNTQHMNLHNITNSYPENITSYPRASNIYNIYDSVQYLVNNSRDYVDTDSSVPGNASLSPEALDSHYADLDEKCKCNENVYCDTACNNRFIFDTARDLVYKDNNNMAYPVNDNTNKLNHSSTDHGSQFSPITNGNDETGTFSSEMNVKNEELSPQTNVDSLQFLTNRPNTSIQTILNEEIMSNAIFPLLEDDKQKNMNEDQYRKLPIIFNNQKQKSAIRKREDPGKSIRRGSLVLEKVQLDDAATYRCRVDMRTSPTRNAWVVLRVVGESRNTYLTVVFV